MSLDALYGKVKHAKFPIHSRYELEYAMKGSKIKFGKDSFDERDISTMITEYPIKTPSHLMELFIKAADEEYQDPEIAREFAKDMK